MSTYQVAELSAKMAKERQGFVAANQRQSCSNCKHGYEQREDRMPPYDTATWRCKLGNFRTTAKAVCQKHEVKQ